MKVYITGSCDIEGIDISIYVPKETDLIISSGKKGIEAEAVKYADEHNIAKLIYVTGGKDDAMSCSKKMVDDADRVVVVWNGVSKKEKLIADYAARRSKTLDVVLINNKADIIDKRIKNKDFIFDALPFPRKM